MTLRYNANLVADGAKKDGDGNTISSTYAKSANLATVATSGDYTDLSNTPTIPAAQVQADWSQSDNTAVDYIKNKPTIPSGVIVDQTYDGTSTNAQSGVAIEGAGFLTGITSSDVTTALGFTPYDSSNPNGYTSNTGTVTSVNNVSPVNGNVTLNIPSISGLADYDLSNLTATGKKVIDGQWVQSNLNVSSATSIASREHDLSSYLPNDSYSYEVMFHLSGGTSSGSSGGSCTLYVGTAAQPSTNADYCIYGFVFVTKTSTEARNYIILPIGSNRKVYSQITGHDFSFAGFKALAYRRIGTNT